MTGPLTRGLDRLGKLKRSVKRDSAKSDEGVVKRKRDANGDVKFTGGDRLKDTQVYPKDGWSPRPALSTDRGMPSCNVRLA